jgi:acetylornithine deacetylase
VRWDIEVHGRSAHTSRPELGINAIRFAVEAIAELEVMQKELHTRHPNALMTGPMLTVTMIHGGRTRNAVPDLCTLSIDHRVVPGMDPMTARETVINRLAEIENATFTHTTPQLITPPLATDPEHSFCQAILEICRQYQEVAQLRGEPYGTDAAWIADRAPALVLGPGDITYAHAVDERIALADVVTGAKIYRDIMLTRFTD